MNNYEGHEFANLFPMMDEVDFENLKNDIKKNGFDNNRAIILYEGKILDGRNRYKATKELNIIPTFIEFQGDNPLNYVISTNLNRRHLNASQRACIALEALPLFEAEAKKRQATSTGGINPQLSPLMEQAANKGKASEQVGQMFGVGKTYVSDAKKLKETNPEKFKEVLDGKKTITEVKKEVKIQEREQKIAEQIKEIESDNVKMPNGLFDVIVIDPPWKYDTEYNPDYYMGRVANPYPEMTLEQLKNMNIPSKDNCIMWLWTTHSQILNAFELLKVWGFKYKAILVWDKEIMGVGHWLRKQCEFCLLGIKGNPIWTTKDTRDILREQRTEHSKKPESFYKMVDQICYGRKIEIFSRTKRDGWEVYGDEV